MRVGSRNSALRLVAGVVAVLLLAGAAQADLIDESPSFPGSVGGSFPTIGGSSGQHVTARFSVPGGVDFFLDEALIVARYFVGANDFDIAVFSDSAGAPGTALETVSGLTFPSPRGQVAAGFSGATTLVAGADYWLVVSPGAPTSHGGWAYAAPTVFGPGGFMSASTSGAWFTQSGHQLSAFQVNGTPVPEPVTLTTAGLGFGFLAWRMRRKRLKNKAA